MACTLTGQMLHNRPVKVELKQSTNQGNANRGVARGNTNKTVIFNPIRPDATREDATARTVHVSGIDARTTEQDLYSFFSFSGTVNAIRMCGDPNLSTRFVFIEFADLAAASSAMNMTGQVLGNFPIKVSPAKSPITNPGQQPGGAGGNPNPYPGAGGAGSAGTGAMQPNTIHIGNLDPSITDATLTQCFTQWCGPVVTSRVSGHVDASRPTRYGFVEFENAASVATALAMDGTLLGSTNVKISRAKAPSRPPAAAAQAPIAGMAGVAGVAPTLAPPGTETAPPTAAAPAAPGTEGATEESTGGKRKASDSAANDEEDGNVAKKARVDDNDPDAADADAAAATAPADGNGDAAQDDSKAQGTDDNDQAGEAVKEEASTTEEKPAADGDAAAAQPSADE
eukprot:TRINITY_DN3941_c0_g1_i2.p1 TRINITY_DN3941_c0_g1~~TRINITY_DN3941_c0_g1_i2.p1  ORF type:complete len:398 (-),score=120.46 TRINITY_DN3941_c0_g1_i2:91-1284(-)